MKMIRQQYRFAAPGIHAIWRRLVRPTKGKMCMFSIRPDQDPPLTDGSKAPGDTLPV